MQKLLGVIFKIVQMTASFFDRTINDHRLGAPEYFGDPYPEYERLLARGSVIRTYVVGGWSVLGFDAVSAVLTDPRISSDLMKNPTIRRMYRMSSGGDSRILKNPLMLSMDPPEHSRIRKLARGGFLHKFVQSLEPKIRRLTNQCLDRVESQKQIELISVLARPLPAMLISDLIGVEVADRDRFRTLAEVFLQNVTVIEFSALVKADKAMGEMLDFMENIVEGKRNNLGDDLISLLITADTDGEKLSSREVTRMCALLMAAGYETTTRLIGNAVYLLLQNPDQLQDLRSDPKLIPQAIEEVLRFEPPVQTLTRTATEDMEILGEQIKKHQTIILVIAAANRDPAANASPQEFNIHREKINHIAFGHGIHLCLGAELARLEAKVALEVLLERYPIIELDTGTPKWEQSYLMRGLDELPLRIS